MKILFTASECVPFVKTGGLADVVGALAPVLARKVTTFALLCPCTRPSLRSGPAR